MCHHTLSGGDCERNLAMKKQLVINIRGTNGSGKSTVPRQMFDTDEDKYVETFGKDYKFTVFPKYKFIALGAYHNKTGGLDGIRSTEFAIKALKEAQKLAKENGYHILLEGVIASSVKVAYTQAFKEAEEDGFKPIVLIYTTPPEVCIPRVYERNGGKPIKESNVVGKYKHVMGQGEYFTEQGITVKKVNTTNTPKELMLTKFLKAVERWEQEC